MTADNDDALQHREREGGMSTYAADRTALPDIEHTRWRIDPARSSVEFHVRHFYGLTTVKGRFDRYDGTLDLSSRPAVVLTIDADSLDTKNQKRDLHLRSADFFDADSHPHVRFVGDGVTLSGEWLKASGRLHAAGKSMPLDVDATLRRVGDELEVAATTLADQRQLGMTWSPLGVVRAPSKLMVRGRLIRAAT